jgi:ATP-dependent DNA ligase
MQDRTQNFGPAFLLSGMLLRERNRPGLGIIEPCLPSAAKVPPSGPGWIHEIKHDGFRIVS